MANGNGNGLKNGLNNKQTLVVALISCILGSASGPYLFSSMGINPYRDDPFKGAEGRSFDRRITALEGHVKDHPDVRNQFDRRITVLETRLMVIIGNQERILDRLEKLGHE